MSMDLEFPKERKSGSYSSASSAKLLGGEERNDEASTMAGDLAGRDMPDEHTPLKKINRRNTVGMGEVYGGKRPEWKIEDGMGTSSYTSTVVNLIVDLTPAGLLPLSVCLKTTGVVPALVLTFGFAALCVWMMYLVGRSMQLTGLNSYASMWGELIGPRTSWFPIVVIQMVTFGCCLAYLCLYADMLPNALPLDWLGTWLSKRTACLMFAVVPLLPLCMLKDLSALSYVSGPAALAVKYTVGVILLRAYDGSYGGLGVPAIFHAEGAKVQVVRPSLGDNLFHVDFSSLKLVNALAVAYLCHYNACKYYRELKDHTPGRFEKVASIGIGSASCVFAVVMVAGFLTFGQATQDVILSSYHKDDKLANAARLCICIALIASFPLMFSGLREATIDFLKFMAPSQMDRTDGVIFQDLLSVVMLMVLITVAVFATDVSVVVGLVGSICGSLTIYVIPCLLYARAVSRVLTSTGRSAELTAVWATLCFGLIVGGLGCYVTINDMVSPPK